MLTVDRMPFSKDSEKQMAAEMASESRNQMIMTIAKNAGAVALLAVFLVFLKRIIKQIQVHVPEHTARPQPVAAMPNPADMVAAVGTNAFTATHCSTTGEQFSTAKAEQPVPADVVNSTPEDVARLVRSWMSEQR